MSPLIPDVHQWENLDFPKSLPQSYKTAQKEFRERAAKVTMLRPAGSGQQIGPLEHKPARRGRARRMTLTMLRRERLNSTT